jgi:hypothetical protein
MDPRIVAATEREVVVLWRQRGLSPSGERFDGEVLGLYEIRDNTFARAQMSYFDTAVVKHFLTRAAHTDERQQKHPGQGRTANTSTAVGL